MKITKFNNFLLEFKNNDKDLIINELSDYFTIGIEIEIETDFKRIKGLRESNPFYYSRSNKKLVRDFIKNFNNFYNQYKDYIDFNYEETITYGLEIVSKPFTTIDSCLEFLNIFIDDYNSQKDWFFTNKTSIHFNLGVVGNQKWNLIKGMVMISDTEEKSYVFKDIESRFKSPFSKSLKQKLIDDISTTKDDKVLNTTDIKELEDYFNDVLMKNIHKPYHNMDKYGMNLSNVLHSQNKYIEFRYVGGEDININILKEKLLYFCYIVYLMTSDYKQKDYYKKLFVFINKIREKSIS